MKRILSLLCIICLSLCLLPGCGEEKTEESGNFKLYYLNMDKTKLNEMGIDFEGETGDVKTDADSLMEILSSDSGDVEYKQPISSNLTYSTSYEDDIYTVNFSAEYAQMSLVEDVLCRAAIVRTLTQLDGISGVKFLVDSAPMADHNGELVGVMSAEDFVENPGAQINGIQETELVLYFANEEGNGLVKETRKVHYSTNISMEKLVVEQLLDGPTISGAVAAIPEETKLVNVSTADGVCFVSLDSGFKNQNYEIQEDIVIYSIVNSLTELDSVNRVQISINGDTSGVYRDSLSLGTMYERNLELLPIE